MCVTPSTPKKVNIISPTDQQTPPEYFCEKCGRPYVSERYYQLHVQKCNAAERTDWRRDANGHWYPVAGDSGTAQAKDEFDTSWDEVREPVTDLTTDEQEMLEFEKDLDIDTIKPDISRVLTKDSFRDMFMPIPRFFNDQLDNLVNKDSEWRPLADIWIFTDQEIEEILDLIFYILKTYFPSILRKLDATGTIGIIIMALIVASIFIKKGVLTVKFLAKRKKEKEHAKGVVQG